jgi:hypothetical protein
MYYRERERERERRRRGTDLNALGSNKQATSDLLRGQFLNLEPKGMQGNVKTFFFGGRGR